MNIKNISVIGLGAMGNSIATFLLKAGYPVKGFDLVRKKMSDLVPMGLKATRSLREAARGADLILLSLRKGSDDTPNWNVVKEVVEGKGKWGRNAPAHPDDEWFLEGLAREKAVQDSDGDGIPDEWEEARGLDKRNPNDRTRVMSSGYTAIEKYINERAERLLIEGRGKNHE